jgi:gp16 family phage-associated protein
MEQGKLLSREEAREKFEREGVSYAEWARKHGVSRFLVATILNEGRACRRGQSHKIAVMLGIKDGVIVDG